MDGTYRFFFSLTLSFNLPFLTLLIHSLLNLQVPFFFINVRHFLV